MIELSRICKSYSLPHGKRKDVLRDVSITFRPGVNMGILGLNGQGKSTLIRIISGSERPDSGTITRKGRVSWPIGFAGGFNGSLTGRENLRFTSRIYGADIQEVTEFVEGFTELGPYMDMPVKTYSSGMRSKLGGCQLNNDAISFQLPLTWNLAKSAIVRSTISRVLDTTIDFLLKRANQCLCLPLFCSRYTVCDLL